MTTLSIPLKDIHLGGEELTTLPAADAIARIQQAYAFLGPVPVTIDSITARRNLAMAHRDSRMKGGLSEAQPVDSSAPVRSLARPTAKPLPNAWLGLGAVLCYHQTALGGNSMCPMDSPSP